MLNAIIIKQKQFKSTIKYHFAPTRLAKLKKKKTPNYLQRGEEFETIIHFFGGIKSGVPTLDSILATI
jgi:hypothetical protein